MEDKNTIKVTCAIIEREGAILAAQRGKDMAPAFKWEFPGGKVEEGESPEDCIVREIREELDIVIKVKHMLKPYTHDYGTRLIELIPFICHITEGEILCKEHRQFVWDFPENLRSLDWAEADIPILEEYIEYLNKIYDNKGSIVD